MSGEEPLQVWGSADHPSAAARRDDVVLRPATPSSATVLALLRHLEQEGVSGCPRVIGGGFADDGREVVSFVHGSSPHPQAWPDNADLHAIGALLRQVHDAAASFETPSPVWQPWWGRALRPSHRVIGHCDAAPWNLVKRDDGSIALIDWEFAGPTDVLTELAYAGWLNAQLHDDDVAEQHRLPGAGARARSLAALLDGYGLARPDRGGFVDALVEVAVLGAAEQAREHAVTPDSGAVTPDGYPVLWAVAWRARSAAWMLRNRPLLERAVVV